MSTQPNESFRMIPFDKLEKRFPLVSLDLNRPIWERFFMVAPLVIIGSRDESGVFDLAPNTWPRRWAGKTTSDSSAHPGTAPIRTSSDTVHSPSPFRDRARLC